MQFKRFFLADCAATEKQAHYDHFFHGCFVA